MTEEISSNTAGEHQNPRKGKPRGKAFTKGDPRINRKGRPKSFDALRALAQQIGAEPHMTDVKQVDENGIVSIKGKPVEIDGHLVTQAERALRSLLTTAPDKFLAIAYGPPPPAKQEVEQSGEVVLRVVYDDKPSG